MRKMVLIPLVFGFILLIVGVVQSYSSIQRTLDHAIIHSTGWVGSDTEKPQPQQTTPTTQLDIIGFLVILVSIGFFTVAYLNRRNSEVSEHTIR
jgi:divalent metal cation (Fe/Co/Zn/Cd) transporter